MRSLKSLRQAAYSAIDFDYLEYARLRWGEYRTQKQSRLEAVAQQSRRQQQSQQQRHTDA